MSIAARRNSSDQPTTSESLAFESVEVTQDFITAYLSDERVISVPLWWSWRLEQATPEQRSNYELIGARRTAYWPDLDEHLSVSGFLLGTPAPRPLNNSAEAEV